ncbi:MAG: hypothetical protein FJW40_04545 [Acidobacteria bacterium]|nr:hypothetical protein [Acidobacteriota bacterium]
MERVLRRTVLAALPGFSLSQALPAAERGVFPSELGRYKDPSTEFEVIRLTDPRNASYLAPSHSRVIGKRSGFLIHTSDRGGSVQAYRLEIKSGELRQLTEAGQLDPVAITMSPDEKFLYGLDGGRLVQFSTGGGRLREVLKPEGDWLASAVSVTVDGIHAVVVERRGSASRIRLVATARPMVRTMVDVPAEVTAAIPRPARDSILYRRADGTVWMVNFDGAQHRQLKLAPGRTGPAQWSPDGRTVLYLNFPEEKGKLYNLREFTPDSNTDRALANTTQFVQFGCNSDASVFVGASGSKASPHVLLLLRVTRREFTLCEHRASEAAMINPMFSPNSQRVFFQSDRHGKPALYMMAVEKFVEETES